MTSAGRSSWPIKLAGDKGYSYDKIRDQLEGCGIEPVIPRKSNQTSPVGEKFDKKDISEAEPRRVCSGLDEGVSPVGNTL